MKALSSIAAALVAVATVLAATPAFATFDVPESAYGAGAIHDGDASVESRLIVDATQVAPGDTITVGVAFTLDHDWHIYWQNPGDSGAPTNIDWQSDALDFGPLQWASPKLFSEAGDMTVYGYDDEVILFSKATVADDAEGSVDIGAKVDYLACSYLCMPGHSMLTRSIPVGHKTVRAGSKLLDAFAAYGARVPRKAKDLGLQTQFHYSQTPIRPNDEFRAVIELVACHDASADCEQLTPTYDELAHAIIPDRFSVPDIEVTSIRDDPDVAQGWLIGVRGKLPAQLNTSRALLSGVFELQKADGTLEPVYLRDSFPRGEPGAAVEKLDLSRWSGARPAHADAHSGAAAATAAKADAPNDSQRASLAWVLLMAFLGGMILNLMPCVFPVLALKISSFTRLVHESKRGVIAHGMAYTGGIVGSLLVLAGVVIGLRSAGTQVGWGFQFQQPEFLALLVAILVLFALNLFGVFEVSVGSQKLHDKAQDASGVRRSIWEGVLAVVLATPCSAPFLGTAVGFALASGPATILAVFTALGLGLAAPLVMLTLVPGWARLLPKPGMWMEHLKKFLGFALLGSATWILWLLGRQAGVDAMASMLAFAGVLGVAAWLYGLVQFRQWSLKKGAAITAALAALGVAGMYVFPLRAQAHAPQRAEASDGQYFKPWSEAAVAAALKKGRPVFVDFGADWCLTCKVNEKNVIDSKKVRQAAKKYDVAMFKADWTNPDERIRKKLAEYGKAGVPFYLMYSPAHPDEPTPLPEVITSQMVVDTFAKAAP